MVRRKAIQLAGKTLVVSLPTSWAKINGIRKGEEVEVTSHGHSLVIEPVDRNRGPVGVVDISGLNASLVWHALVWRYIAGFRELEVRFGDELIWDPRSGARVAVSEVIDRVVEGLIGMEVVRVGKSGVTVREISQVAPDEYGVVMRRVWVSVLSMADEVVLAMRSRDGVQVQLAVRQEKNVNRLVLYALRIVGQGLSPNIQSAMVDSRLLHSLEVVGDMVHGLPRGTYPPSLVRAVVSLAKVLRSAYECWFSPSNPAAEKMYADLVVMRECKDTAPFMVLAVENLVEAVNGGMALRQNP